MEPTPFVGRAEEIEGLERALRRVQSKVGSTVVVAGEAGIGKSRLASKLTTRARDAGFEVLVGRCIDLIGTELPYQPFADALRPWAARHGEGALPWLSQVRPAGSQLRVFEETLALGLEHLRLALRLAEQRGDPGELVFAYCWLTDVLTMLGRPRESIRVAAAAVSVVRTYGVAHGTIVYNQVEALIATGEWDEADRLGAAALRPSTANWPHFRRLNRAALAVGRGDFADARLHLEAAHATVRGDERASPVYDLVVTELALWERGWTDAETFVRDGLARTRGRESALIRVQLCAQGLRAQAELTALGRARRDADIVRDRLGRARKLLLAARRAAAEAAPVTPNAAGWRAQAEAEYARALDQARPVSWSEAATRWDQLERPPLAAYCRWRQAEALVARGAGRADAGVPLREAHAVAARLRAQPLLQEVELLATRARLELAWPEPEPPHLKPPIEDLLGLTPREAEVLALVARGHTNREIAEELVISIKTTGHHVSHILHKLDVATRADAAAIAHRIGAAR